MRWIVKITLIILAGTQPALADIAGQDGSNYYATGKSEAASQVTSEADSCASAKRELIAYIFGLTTKVNSNVVQTLDKTQLTQTINVNSDWLHLKGISQEVKTLPSGNKFVSECTILYPVAEANREKARIEKARAVLASGKLHRATFENADPVNFGRLTIRSNAPKSKVFLDSVFWGNTPLEIDRVSIGEHSLSVSADNFVTGNQVVSINIGDSKEVFVTLKRNWARLELLGLPPKATVWLNGMRAGSTAENLEPGEVIIRIEAPLYKPIQDSLKLAAGANLQHSIKMLPKPVSVAFTSKGEQAQVYLNGENIGNTPITKNIEVGQYAADFMTSRGLIYSQSFTLNPSESFSVTAPKQEKTSTVSAKFAAVVLYKDSSLTVRKDYSSFRKIPPLSADVKQVGLSIEFVEPKNGFIYVNDKLAGSKAVVIDDLTEDVTIRFEAPGYYSDEQKFSKFLYAAEGDYGSIVRMKYRGVNDYKIFMFRKRSQTGGAIATVARAAHAFNSDSFIRNIVGYYDDLLFHGSYEDVKLADIRLSFIPALIVKVDDPADRDQFNGLVTEILLSDSKYVIKASDIFGGSRTTSENMSAKNGYLSGRTLFFGDSFHFPLINRASGGSYVCGWKTCSNRSGGAPFATVKVKVSGDGESDVTNAKRYSH